MNLDKISEEAYGFSGAQLESVMNEAAIYMMREELTEVEQRHLSMAIDKVMMGEKRTEKLTTKRKTGGNPRIGTCHYGRTASSGKC